MWRPLPLLARTPPTPRQYLSFALIWLAIALGLALVIVGLRLPERMNCAGGGGNRYAHCQHGLLSSEVWRRP